MRFFDNEIAYLSAFCDAEPLPCGVRLRDARMPDMYSHNLTCVRDALSEAPLTELAVREIARRCAQGADFLNLTLHFAPEQPWLDALPDGCEHTRYGCYTLRALRGPPPQRLRDRANDARNRARRPRLRPCRQRPGHGRGLRRPPLRPPRTGLPHGRGGAMAVPTPRAHRGRLRPVRAR